MNRCRIYPATQPPPAELVTHLRTMPTTVVSDQLERCGNVKGVYQITSADLGFLAGPALTVRTRPGDNLAIYKAIEIASAGDVLVVDAGGAMDRAVVGEIVYRHAATRGIAGFVIDGLIRDGADIAKGRLPVFAKGFTHAGPYKSGPGEIRGPITVGGAVVHNGDIVVGDTDGVAVVPIARAQEVVAGGLKLLAREQEALAQADAGELDVSWLDDLLDVEWVDSTE